MKELIYRLKQEHKWGELNTFFKEHSQYYKQIDNDEVVFIVGMEGTDFIANLFLNDLTETLTNNRIQSELIWDHVKYNRQGPEQWFDDHIIWDSPGHTDSKQHTTLLPESFEILKTLNTPETLSYDIDTNLKNFFSNDKTLNGTRYFITQLLPVIAYFYYKNFEKVKIILIEIDDMNLSAYADFFRALRISHGIGDSARSTLESWVEENGLYTILAQFAELKKITGDNEYTNGIFLNAMISNQWTFVKAVERFLNCLEKLDNIKPMYIDINHRLSSNSNAGMMNFPIFADQLYKIDYRKLFFEQNITDIKILITLFNAEYTLKYYQDQIQKYNSANFELKNQLEKELFAALVKLKNE